MNGRLFPRLRFHDDETPVSWATRLAALHTGGRLVPFLNDCGIAIGDLTWGKNGSLEKLCELGGEAVDRVARNAVLRTSPLRYKLRGEEFSAEFLERANTAFCPACLLEDDAMSDNPGPVRRGRLAWTLRAVRTCPIHELAILGVPRPLWNHKTNELAVRVPERADELKRMADECERRAVSPLQRYIADRLEGRSESPWLDGQGIEQALRASEMLGAVIEFGRKPNIGAFSDSDWHRAGRAGFEATSRGELGVREALQEIMEAMKEPTVNGGAQQYFGRFYQWLQPATHRKDPGPIRSVLREHILDTLEVPPGQILLGAAVETRRRHSIASLAREAGVHPTTLHNMLVAKHIIAADAKRSGWQSTFEAAEGDRIAAAMQRAVPLSRLPALLNCTRGQAIRLVDAQVLKSLDGAEARTKGRVSRAIDQADIDHFLATLDRRAHPVEEVPPGFATISSAAQIVAVTSARVVSLVLDGTLKRTCRLKGVEGYAGIVIDPEEVLPFVERSVEGLTVTDAFGEIRVTPATGKALVADREGGALLKTTLGPGFRQSSSTHRVTREDLNAFHATYVTHAKLGRQHGLHHTLVSSRLREAGIVPIPESSEIGTRIYRVEDVRHAGF